MKWSRIYAILNAVSVNFLVFISPGAILTALWASGDHAPPQYFGILFVTCLTALSANVPFWVTALTLSALSGPEDIRDYRNIYAYLEKLQKAHGDPTVWPQTLVNKTHEWNTHNSTYKPAIRKFITGLIFLSLLDCLATYLVFVSLIVLSLGHWLHVPSPAGTPQ